MSHVCYDLCGDLVERSWREALQDHAHLLELLQLKTDEIDRLQACMTELSQEREVVRVAAA